MKNNTETIIGLAMIYASQIDRGEGPVQREQTFESALEAGYRGNRDGLESVGRRAAARRADVQAAADDDQARAGHDPGGRATIIEYL